MATARTHARTHVRTHAHAIAFYKSIKRKTDLSRPPSEGRTTAASDVRAYNAEETISRGAQDRERGKRNGRRVTRNRSESSNGARSNVAPLSSLPFSGPAIKRLYGGTRAKVFARAPEIIFKPAGRTSLGENRGGDLNEMRNQTFVVLYNYYYCYYYRCTGFGREINDPYFANPTYRPW